MPGGNDGREPDHHHGHRRARRARQHGLLTEQRFRPVPGREGGPTRARAVRFARQPGPSAFAACNSILRRFRRVHVSDAEDSKVGGYRIVSKSCLGNHRGQPSRTDLGDAHECKVFPVPLAIAQALDQGEASNYVLTEQERGSLRRRESLACPQTGTSWTL